MTTTENCPLAVIGIVTIYSHQMYCVLNSETLDKRREGFVLVVERYLKPKTYQSLNTENSKYLVL